MYRILTLSALLAVSWLTTSCQTVEKADYTAYREHMPQSILVLPPQNESNNIKATGALMSIIAVPIAEKGYYVPPVAIVQEYLQQNGLPTAGEMHQAPIGKLGDFFGADAVLYLTIKEWRTQTILISTSTTVTLEARLVDVDTGTTLWEQNQSYSHSESGGGSIEGAIVASLMQATVLKDSSERRTSAFASGMLINDPNTGFLQGHRAKKAK